MANDLDQSVSNAIAGGISTPIDILAWALRKAGVPGLEKPVAGSDWMREKGFTKDVAQSPGQIVGETVGNLLDPLAAGAKMAHLLPLLLRTTSDFEKAMRAEKLVSQGGSSANLWNALKVFKYPRVAEGITQARYGIEVPSGKLTPKKDASVLEDIYDAPELYSKLPELRSLKLEHEIDPIGDSMGYYDEGRNVLGLNLDASPTELRETLGHELNHVINKQTKQTQSTGFISEGIQDYDMPRIKLLQQALRDKPIAKVLDSLTPFDSMGAGYEQQYSRSMGEQLAEADALRSAMSPVQRRKFSPTVQMDEIRNHPMSSKLELVPDDLMYEITHALRKAGDKEATESFVNRMQRYYR